MECLLLDPLPAGFASTARYCNPTILGALRPAYANANSTAEMMVGSLRSNTTHYNAEAETEAEAASTKVRVVMAVVIGM